MVAFLGTGSKGTKGIFTVRTDTREVSALATDGDGVYSNLRLSPSVNGNGTVAFVATLRSSGMAALLVQVKPLLNLKGPTETPIAL